MLRHISRTAALLGTGLTAGLAGTAVMTGVQAVEMKVSGREGSSVPAKAVETVLDVEAESEDAEQQLTQLTHWAYGTALGAARGLISAVGLCPPYADLAFFGVVWGGALTMLPSLGLAPPPTEWPGKQVAMDAAHHAVYAVAVGAVFEALVRADD